VRAILMWVETLGGVRIGSSILAGQTDQLE
jgi:hypothetical protein